MDEYKKPTEAPDVVLEPGAVDEGKSLADAEISPMVSVPTEPEPEPKPKRVSRAKKKAEQKWSSATTKNDGSWPPAGNA